MMYIQTRKGDLNSGVSSSSTPLRGGDYEAGDEQKKENDYEVFLSFRWKDTGKGFTDYLYTSLVNVGIQVFRDDSELCVGEEIGPELLHSIMQSKISIPIISKDYAASKKCLCELAQIIKCKRSKGQIVLPIFYQVEVSEVGHLKGRFGEAIHAHKEKLDKMVVREWEVALKEISRLKGWESEKMHNGYEGKLVKEIVRQVTRHLKGFFQLNVPKQLVGIDDPLQRIMSFIGENFNDSKTIGIYGMGGVGKTTLAKVLYNKLSSHFDYCSFLANIRETSQREGIVYIQKQLLYGIIGTSFEVFDVDYGVSVIRTRFTYKKVLILLDDIDDNFQVKYLIGDGSWFAVGSIFIITTRNRGNLDEARVDYTYQLNELSQDQSMILFSRHAFQMDSPPNDFEVIARDVVSTTDGLPLALEKMGSFLRGKSKAIWKQHIKKNPNKVPDTWKISFDSLGYNEKHIFLDIACFFVGSSIQGPIYMWDAYSLDPRMAIKVLSSKSLIKIDKDGKLLMNHLLQDFGRKIAQENQEEPQKRSRLWIYEEAVDVLDSDKGNSKIEALCLDECDYKRSYTDKQFKELTNLRFLKVCGVNFIGDFQDLLPKLRWLQWEHCPSDFAATNFHPKNLVVLDLSKSQISEDWGGWDPLKNATKLKVLDLTSCRFLKRTPDLSAFKSLEILILEKCDDLAKIHPSIDDIKTLISLNANSCKKLEELPVAIGKMKKLRELLINDTAIQEIPCSGGGLMKLEILSVSCCKRLKELPAEVGRMKELRELLIDETAIREIPILGDGLLKLETLSASGCTILEELPANVGRMQELRELILDRTNIREIPISEGGLMKLETLSISCCTRLKELPAGVGRMQELRKLILDHTDIQEIPTLGGGLMKLDTLSASCCARLKELPAGVGRMKELRKLLIDGTTIREIPISSGLMNLKTLCASYCEELTQLSEFMGSLVKLVQLDLSHSGIKELPESMGFLKGLTQLDLSHSGIKKLPESIGSLEQLTELDVSHSEIEELPKSMGSLVSLTQLDLSHSWIEQLPKSIGSLTSLTLLNLSHSGIQEFPKFMDSLESLTHLDLSHIGIEELPESIRFLKKLQTLNASWCGLAKIHSSIGHLKYLSLLDLRECNKLAQLPNSIGSLVSLQRLLLRGCYLLREIPSSIEKLASLTELNLKSTAIVEVPYKIQNMQNLKIYI